MATLAADPNAIASEARRAPASLTNFGGLLLVGGGLLLVLLAGFARFYSGEDNHVMARFWHAYLLNASFAASISLGGLFFVIAHHLTGGRWATSLRRLAEIVAGTTIFSAGLFAPVVINVMMESHDLYVWNDYEGHVAGDSVLEAKRPYLNPGWFTVRTVAYFAIWCTLASIFVGASLKQDETGEVAGLRRLSRLSGPGMVLFALSLNFAAFDWLMSLAPHWFSTMFGVYYFAGSVIGFLSVLLMLAIGLQKVGVLTVSVTTDNLHDVAKLLYAFVVFWGYISFSQFMLIWYANVPEETEWFAIRQLGNPTSMGISSPLGWLFILHLIVPFLTFMSSAVRRNRVAMFCVAIYMLAVHWLDLVFVVMPGIEGYEKVSAFGMIGPFELIGLIAVIAYLLGAIMQGAEGRWLLPVRDPRLKQAMTYHNH